MIRKLRIFLVGVFLATFVIGAYTPSVNAAPVSIFAATCSGNVIGFPAWYDGLSCKGTQPTLTNLNDMWIIALNVVQDLTMLVMYFAVGYVIWGGFKYIKSEGDPGKISEAKMAIVQAIAGFIIAISAVAIINFVQSTLGVA